MYIYIYVWPSPLNDHCPSLVKKVWLWVHSVCVFGFAMLFRLGTQLWRRNLLNSYFYILESLDSCFRLSFGQHFDVLPGIQLEDPCSIRMFPSFRHHQGTHLEFQVAPRIWQCMLFSSTQGALSRSRRGDVELSSFLHGQHLSESLG